MNDLFLTYKGNQIHYTDKGYINVTEMAKIFGKNPAQFFRHAMAQEYIQALSKATGLPESELKYAVKGGDLRSVNSQDGLYPENSPNEPMCEFTQRSDQGTFCHPKLAIRFAQWLNADFAVWVDGKILDLLGYTQSQPESTEILISRALIAANDLLNEQKDQIRFLESRAKAFEDLTESEGLFSFADCAKILNFKDFGEKKLFDFCRKKGLLTSNNKPIGKFLEKGYFQVKIVSIRKGYSRSESYPKTHITSKGIAFIRELLITSGEYYPNRGAA